LNSTDFKGKSNTNVTDLVSNTNIEDESRSNRVNSVKAVTINEPEKENLDLKNLVLKEDQQRQENNTSVSSKYSAQVKINVRKSSFLIFNF
jgi:uncharacterized protein (DUF342 family)